jgi:DNA polymerase-3 subunit beta
VREIPFRDKAVLPKKGVLELKRLLDDSNKDVELGFDGTSGIVRFKNTTLYMRRIVGEFPDYRKVIPEETKRNAAVNRQEFIGALKRMSLMSSAKHKLVRFDFSAEKLEMSCQNPEIGTAREEVTLRYDGNPMTIGFNPKYYLDALSVIDEKEVNIGFLDELSPAILHSKENTFKCVIMPMRL